MRIFFFAYFITELIVFILFGMWLGFGWTILLFLGLFIAGIALSAWQMRSLAERAKQRTDAPGRLTADAALSASGAFLVAVPGIVSTVLGIFLLLPPTRALSRKLMGAATRAALVRFGGMTFTTASTVSSPDAKNYPGWGEVIDHRTDEFGDR